MQQLEDIVQSALLTKLDTIMKDESHPLHDEVIINRSGRIRLEKQGPRDIDSNFLFQQVELLIVSLKGEIMFFDLFIGAYCTCL